MVRAQDKPGAISTAILWALHMSDDDLAHNLRVVARNIRRFNPLDRQVLLNEAAKRLKSYRAQIVDTAEGELDGNDSESQQES